MNKSGGSGGAGSEQENTKYAQEEDNTKYATGDEDNTKYAQADENTKYAKGEERSAIYAQAEDNTKYASADADNTKYAQAEDNTKYASADTDNTKYARAEENTKYAGGDRAPANLAPLLLRRAVDSAIEEALMSATAAVDRIHAGISKEARARLVGTLIEKFGSELLEAHLGVTRSDRRG